VTQCVPRQEQEINEQRLDGFEKCSHFFGSYIYIYKSIKYPHAYKPFSKIYAG
jgi:hypothetical protein